MKQLFKITKKQIELLDYLYKFYFLNTNQFQKLCHHKKPQTVQKWLKDLKDKGYINIHKTNENKFIAKTQPTIYYLDKLARQKLKSNQKYDIKILNRVYRKKTLSNEFIKNSILIADIYINLLSQIKTKEKLYFFTRTNLKGFDYFPQPPIDAYIAVKTQKNTRRSFLILINSKIPWRTIDQRMRDYVAYSYDNQWSDYSLDPLPSFFIVCPNKTTQKHLYSVIENEFPAISFYLTIKETIQELGFMTNIWEKVKN